MLQYNYIDYMKKVIGMVSGMDADKVFSVCILVVKEDLTCNYIVEEMLRPYCYQVLHTGGGLDVLKAIWESKERLHLVLTNANKLGSSGTEIVRHIRNTLGLPVLPLSCDKRKIGSKGQPFSFAAYMLSGLSINGVENFWQMALEMEKDKMVASHPEENVQGAPVPDVAVETNKTSSSINDAARLNQKHKGVDLSEGSKKDHPKAKKPRVVWTIEMHQKFLKALDIIGYDKAVPKKIVEIMNVPGLTRENVASHLQKFRGSVKRTQETVFSSLYTRDELEGFRVLSSPPASRFSSSQTNVTTPCPQSSYISAAKESVTSSECHYLNMHKDFSFGAALERKAHISIRGLSFRDQSGVDKLHQKHFHELYFTPNFRIYNVEKRNMLLSKDGISSSDVSHHQSYISKFVGYRVTSDGKSVAYGNTEAPTNTSFQGLSVSGIHGNETSFINMCGKLALHSSEGQRYENLDPSTPPSIAFEQHISLQPFEHSGNEEDIEKCFSLVDQSNQQPANVAPSENPLEVDMLVQNTSAPSMMILHRDEGLPFPPLEFLDAISQQQYSSPSPLPQVLQYMDEIFDQSENEDPLLKGTGSRTSHQFDFEEFDDTLIGQDD